MQKDTHKISVVLLTKNSVTTVQKSIESILTQTRKPDEIVAVDGNSSDGTLDVLKRYPVKLYTEPGLGFGYARNLAVKHTSGDIIFFLDSDCYVEPNCLENVLRAFDSDPQVVGVTGPTHLWNTDSVVARFLAHVNGRTRMPTTPRFVKIAPTMNLTVKREAIDEVDGFDENLIRGEDTDLTYRISLKHKILYDPNVPVWFMGSPNFRTASKKCSRHFAGVGQIFAKDGVKSVFVRFNLPARGLLLIALILSIFLLPWYVPAVLFSVYLFDFAYRSTKLYRRYHDSSLAYYFIFFTYWSLASLAIIYGFFLGLKNKGRRLRIKS